MKTIITVLTFFLMFTSCVEKEYYDTLTTLKVNTVTYHQSGRDNTLQFTPYWKLYLVNEVDTISTISFRSYQVGDSVKVIIRKYVTGEKK